MTKKQEAAFIHFLHCFPLRPAAVIRLSAEQTAFSVDLSLTKDGVYPPTCIFIAWYVLMHALESRYKTQSIKKFRVLLSSFNSSTLEAETTKTLQVSDQPGT